MRESAGQPTGGLFRGRGAGIFRAITKLGLTAALAFSSGATKAAAPVATCHPRAVNIRHANNPATLTSGTARDLCVLELRGTTISEALAELLTPYNVSYRSSIALSETLDGTYAGSLKQVISRLLDGYDYIIKRDGVSMHVVIVARKGERAIVAPAEIQVSERTERPVHGSRDH